MAARRALDHHFESETPLQERDCTQCWTRATRCASGVLDRAAWIHTLLRRRSRRSSDVSGWSSKTTLAVGNRCANASSMSRSSSLTPDARSWYELRSWFHKRGAG